MAAIKNPHDKQFKKGHQPWNKGVHVENAGTFKSGHQHSDETLSKISQSLKGRTAWNKGLKNPQGEKHWNWKGGVSRSDERLERQKFFKYVKPKVMLRDDYTCQVCDQVGGNLHVDHIKRWADYPDMRFDMSNCRTVCMACHYYITFKKKLPAGQVWGNNLMFDRKRG
jgi:hypothetical protein